VPSGRAADSLRSESLRYLSGSNTRPAPTNAPGVRRCGVGLDNLKHRHGGADRHLQFEPRAQRRPDGKRVAHVRWYSFEFHLRNYPRKRLPDRINPGQRRGDGDDRRANDSLATYAMAAVCSPVWFLGLRAREGLALGGGGAGRTGRFSPCSTPRPAIRFERRNNAEHGPHAPACVAVSRVRWRRYSHSTGGTLAGTYSLTVTGNLYSGNATLQHSLSLTLTVR
jgi:hypothetical protein